MNRTRWSLRFACAALLGATTGCGSSNPPPAQPAVCSVANQTGCKTGQACEQVVGGQPACFTPLTVQGTVYDVTDKSPIAGAHVVARDINGAAVSGVAITDKDGKYKLQVPAPRNTSGKPVQTNDTLRADAEGYLTFPKAPRVALPVDLSTATGKPPVVQSTATDIGLIPLPDASNLGSVSGKVIAKNPGGTLVDAAGVTGLADTSGEYTVFNVPAGSVDVHGYLAGVQLKPATASVQAGKTTSGVDLQSLGAAAATVSGTVQIVNAPGGSTTSVILVVEDTFVQSVARGEAPPGLRVEHVSGAWSIHGVPDGKYVVLAAFENDGLVRDPDTSIGGTQIVHITVNGASQTISQGFKVTGALAVYSPGANGPEEVSGTPQFSWQDDTSEDSYTVDVFDALGNQIWEKTGVLGPKGNAPVTLTYGGPALQSGMYYQFRAVSIKSGTPISSTEDLKGVFIYR